MTVNHTDEKPKSDASRAFNEDGEKKTHIGGQALIEGIMMRGKFGWAVAVREPSGNIYTEEHDLNSGKKKNGWMYWPFIRGCRALVESFTLGYKALSIAAAHAFEGEEAPSMRSESSDSEEPLRHGYASEKTSSEWASQEPEERPFSWKDDFGNPEEMIDALGAQTSLEPVPVEEAQEELEGEKTEEKAEFGTKEMAISMVLGLVLGIVLFIVAPALIANLIVGEYNDNTLLWNIVDGLVRVVVFLFYLWLVGRMSDIKRMFAYHGAEHKTIHCYENGLPLTVENARTFSRLHVRCGTAFMIMVMIIAILVYTIIPINMFVGWLGIPEGAPTLIVVILARIALLPLIAGISYEITVKWAGSRPNNPVVKVILWPGLQLQYLTTNEPDDGQLECAIEAMQLVLYKEEQCAEEAQCSHAKKRDEDGVLIHT